MEYALRGGAPPTLREIHRFSSQLNLECDINHRAAYLGDVRGDPMALRFEFLAMIRQTGVTRALAYALDIPEESVTTGFEVGRRPLPDDPDLIAEAATSYHNAHPLALNEVLRVWLQLVEGGKSLLFCKLNHLSTDARDAAELFAGIRGYFGRRTAMSSGGFSQTPEYHRRFDDLPRADLDAVEKALGEVATPGIRGIPLIARARTRQFAIRDGLTFDEVLASVARALAPWAGSQVVLHYPYTHKTFRAAPGPFVEIKPLVVDVAALESDGPPGLRRRRQVLESSGRFDASELTGFNAELKRRRVPRVIVSDTTLFRPEGTEWQWVPTRSARTYDDLKFYVDRTRGHGLARVQYKEGFLGSGVLEDVVARVQAGIGCASGSDRHP
ncbi:hypothetical protein [Microbispora triticiradicis]|uniref:hypothetical protein n=1 Tax=Microbispora triticiradicis TaxID=2200763 RepID=UPI001059138A|nr:hypothetical protein [Microbispora triticiradicis]